jgi:hypothetical protein
MAKGSKLPALTYLPLWLQALEEEIGILIEVRKDTRILLVNALYEARKQSLNPALQELMVFTPKEDLIYIAKKAVELDA